MENSTKDGKYLGGKIENDTIENDAATMKVIQVKDKANSFSCSSYTVLVY